MPKKKLDRICRVCGASLYADSVIHAAKDSVLCTLCGREFASCVPDDTAEAIISGMWVGFKIKEGSIK